MAFATIIRDDNIGFYRVWLVAGVIARTVKDGDGIQHSFDTDGKLLCYTLMDADDRRNRAARDALARRAMIHMGRVVPLERESTAPGMTQPGAAPIGREEHTTDTISMP